MSQDETDNILRAFDRDANRRSVLRGLVAMGAGGLAFGQFAEALAQATSDEVAQLTILSQPGVVPEILKDVTLPLYKKTHPKTEIAFEAASNAVAYPKMLAQRSNPVVSGAMVNDLFAQRGINDKMWDRFDPAFVPNASALPAGFTTPGGFGIPFHLSPWGIMYNPDKVEEPKSWTDLWNPKYKGRVSMWDVYYDAYIMAGVVTGKGPDIEAGIKAWAPHKENIGAWVNLAHGRGRPRQPRRDVACAALGLLDRDGQIAGQERRLHNPEGRRRAMDRPHAGLRRLLAEGERTDAALSQHLAVGRVPARLGRARLLLACQHAGEGARGAEVEPRHRHVRGRVGQARPSRLRQNGRRDAASEVDDRPYPQVLMASVR